MNRPVAEKGHRTKSKKIPIGSSRHYIWLQGIVAVTLVMNVLDGILTLYWIFAGRATEANPLMRTLISIGPIPFITLKMTLVILGSYLLWRLRRHAAAVVSIFFVFLIYYYIILYHLQAMNLRLIQRLLD